MKMNYTRKYLNPQRQKLLCFMNSNVGLKRWTQTFANFKTLVPFVDLGRKGFRICFFAIMLQYNLCICIYMFQIIIFIAFVLLFMSTF
jgi:hypothetical protein